MSGPDEVASSRTPPNEPLDFLGERIAGPLTPPARLLTDVWTNHRDAAGRLPYQDEISLREISGVAQNLFLVRCHGDGSDLSQYEYKRTGSELEKMINFSINNRNVAGFYSPQTSGFVLGVYSDVVVRHMAVFTYHRFMDRKLGYFFSEGVQLPIIHRETNTVSIFGGLFFVKAVVP